MAGLKYKNGSAFASIAAVAGAPGNGIESITQTTTSSSSSGSNVITVKMTSGATSTFTVKNGAQGEVGPTGPAGGLQNLANSSTAGYLTLTKADGTTADLGGFLPLSGGTLTGNLTAPKVYGAVWNDYAEFREVRNPNMKPGKVVYEVGDDTLAGTSKRLMSGCSIISDTYGFAIGETDKAKTPLAVCGRVLAYPYEDRNSYKPGDAVCSAPGGMVSKMTRDEIMMYPDRIIGYVSCVPTYEVWGEKNTKVDGRIWIKVI